MHYIGLMSGTSVDAADAVLVTFAQSGAPHIKATVCLPPPTELRTSLLRLSQAGSRVSPRTLGRLHQRLGDWFADAALAVMDKGHVRPVDIAAIGSHGQTMWHEPDGEWPFSMQLGSASRMAARTGCTVVSDFRSADMAVGGQGAPLVPAFHRHLFARADRARIVVNIGGIANITVLPAGSEQDDSAVSGFDTGPGNALMDGWAQRHLGAPMDGGGHWAASGTVHAGLLARMRRDPYLHRAPPKSTGREYFNAVWLRQQLAAVPDTLTAVDVQATLCEFTAATIAAAVKGCGADAADVIICGGGAHNACLMRRLAALLRPRPVATTTDHGIDGDWVEAVAFAWLAKRRIEGLPGNLPRVTGARALAILGAIHAPPLGPPASDGE